MTAVPQDSDEYLRHARSLGYQGDDAPARMSREHELLHTFLADRLRSGGASPTLWAVAHGQSGMVAPIWEQEEEEGLVLAFQRHLNGLEPGDEIRALTDRGVAVEELKEAALRLLRGSDGP